MITGRLLRLGLQVRIQLRIQHPLGQRLLQFADEAIRLQCSLRVSTGQQPVQ